MKRILTLLAVVAVLALASLAGAQTISYLHTIDTATYLTNPSSIVFHDGDIYMTSFTDQRVIKIEDPRSTTPTVTAIANTSAADSPAGPVTWESGRGLSGIAVNAAGEIYVTGDAGGTGSGGIVICYNPDGSIKYQALGLDRCAGCALWDSDQSLVVTGILNDIYEMSADLSTEESATTVTNNYPRDVAVVGNDLYIVRNLAVANDSIDLLTGGTIGDLSSYSAATSFYSGTAQSSQGAHGLGYWDYNGATPKDYIMWVQKATALIEVVDISDASVDYTLGTGGTVDVAMSNLNDVCAGAYGSDEYIFVAAGGGLVVFGVDGATPVQDWTVY